MQSMLILKMIAVAGIFVCIVRVLLVQVLVKYEKASSSFSKEKIAVSVESLTAIVIFLLATLSSVNSIIVASSVAAIFDLINFYRLFALKRSEVSFFRAISLVSIVVLSLVCVQTIFFAS